MKNNIRNEIKEQVGFKVDYYNSFEQDCYNIIARRVSESTVRKMWVFRDNSMLGTGLMHGIHVSISSQMNENE